MKRKRRAAPPGEFEDPLSNYDPPEYRDDLAEALGEARVTDMQTTPFTTVAPSDTVGAVLRTMAELDVGCVLVAESEKLLGILSERDVVNKIAGDFDRVKDMPVTEVMTPEPVSVYETDSPAKALNLMAVGAFRHVPILDVDGRIAGILGPRRVTNYLQQRLQA